MPSFRFAAPPLLLALLLVGCQPGASGPADPLAPVAPAAQESPTPPRSLGFARYVPRDAASEVPDFSKMSPEELAEDARKALAGGVSLSQSFRGLERWQDADAAVGAMLAEPLPEGSRDHRRHNASVVMLDQYLLSAPATPEALDALAHYARVLLEEETLSVGLVWHALERVQGHLPEAERRELAREARALALSHLARLDAHQDGATQPGVRDHLTFYADRLQASAG